MAEGPQFRIARPSDAEVLLDFMEAYYAFDGHGYDREKARSALIPLVENADLGRVWLVLDGDTPIGYAVLCFGYSLEWLGRDAFVDELYLREDYRDRGFGRKMMAFLEDAAREFGVTTLHLAVEDGNSRALHLYESVGFRRHQSAFLSKWIARNTSKPERPSRKPHP